MSQRSSGFERKPAEYYPTPPWVARALAEVIDLRGLTIWEPAAGKGMLADELSVISGVGVFRSDIEASGDAITIDFLGTYGKVLGWDAIVTNPPYGGQGRTAAGFIKRGLQHLTQNDGKPDGKPALLALLLPIDFDSAHSRRSLFADCEMFAGKIILTKRIKWFDEEVICRPCGGAGFDAMGGGCPYCRGRGKKKSSPSTNHAWFLWRRGGHAAGPGLWYAPKGGRNEAEKQAEV